MKAGNKEYSRAETLRLSIEDAQRRIESNPTDENYGNEQRAKIQGWQLELDEIEGDNDGK